MLNSKEEQFCRVYVRRKCDGQGLDTTLLDRLDVMTRIVELMEKPSLRRGRPSSFDQDIADIVCERIANDESLDSVCSSDDMPGSDAIDYWRKTNNEFAEQYARARERRAELITEKMVAIEHRVLNGGVDSQAGNVVLNSMRWRSMKMAPRTLGDKIEVNNTGGASIVNNTAIIFNTSDPAIAAREYQALMKG